MEFKGTKPPWYVQFMPDDSNIFWVKSDHNEVVHYGTDIMAEDYGEQNGYPEEQRMADAKLIAAAPELLEALQEADEYLSGNKKNYIGNGSILHTKFKEAIEKALK